MDYDSNFDLLFNDGPDVDEKLQKYVKVVYQTPPIGPEGIVLELTTIDFDALKKDNVVKEKVYRTKSVFPIDSRIPPDVLITHLAD